MGKNRIWVPALLLTTTTAGLIVSLLIARSSSEEAHEATFAEAALRQRMAMLRDARGRIPPDGLVHGKLQADRLRSRHRQRVQNQQAAIGPEQSSLIQGAAASAPSASAVPWKWLGPNHLGGRVRALAIHPTKPDVMFAGSAGGGIWKTTDAGNSWTACDDFMAALAVSSIVFDPRNPNVLYASTGEGYHNGDGLIGAGIFKSTDAGTTWAQLPATARSANPDFSIVNRLAISPDGSTLLSTGTYGIYRSTDGGASFTRTSAIQQLTQVAFNPRNAAEAIAAGYIGGTLFSRDAGLSWTASSGFPGGTARVEVAYSRSDGSIYASVDLNGGTVYRSLDGGASFTRVGEPGILFGQGWYDNAIWVNPLYADNVVVGGVNISESFDGGVTWAIRMSADFHADQHAIVEDPRFDGVTNTTVYIGNDGGVFKWTDLRNDSPSSLFVALNNNLGITQFYGGAGNVTTGVILGGTQDNGLPRYSPATGTEWTQTSGGDAGFTVADATDPNYYYSSAPYTSPYRTSSQGNAWESIGAGITDGQSANFIGPIALDPNNPQRFYVGRNNLWRTDAVKGSSPQFISVKPPSSANLDYISAIAVARGDSNLVWVGHNQGDVFKTTNGTSAKPTWTRVARFGSWISRITIDPDNPNDVFVTRTGLQPDNIQHTFDGGVTWTASAGAGDTAIPDVPVYDLEIDPGNPQTIYAGTELGVFVSTDRGVTWDVTGEGPANTRVAELFWMGRTLVVATHGRGMFALDLGAPSGTPVATVTPSTVSFGDQGVGTTSGARSIKLANSGSAPLIVQSVTRSGSNAADFAIVSDACTGATIAAGASCAIQITFRPGAAGSRAAAVVVADNAGGSPRSVPLSGTGVAAAAPLPSPWTSSDIGAVGQPGRSTYSNGTFTVSGAGADVWGTADAFQFAYQPLSGDGTIVARVGSVQPLAPWTKAGVMIRQSLSAGAAHAFMIVSAGKGLAFQRRNTSGGVSTSTSGIAGAAPRWVKLVRAGSTVTAATSSDGTSWTIVGQDTIDLGSTAYIGLALSSHDVAQTATATFDQVTISPAAAPTGTLPAGWAASDVGSVGTAGKTTSSGGTFTVEGAGADVWDRDDAFRFAYAPLTGDGTIVARVTSIEPVAAWTKAGVMLRQTLSADSAHAFMLVSVAKGLAFQRRTAQGGLSTSTSGATVAAPRWVKLVRAGQTVSAFAGADGISWTLVGQDTIALTGTIWAGLAVSSHDPSTAATATFDNVAITPASSLPSGWSDGDIGSVGVAGSAAWSGGVFELEGAGADVWGSADAFHYAYVRLAADGEIVARVSSVDDVQPWTKAGVMIRASLSPSSAQAFMLVSSGRGVAFQRRVASDGVSTSSPSDSGVAPAWVRLVRRGAVITAYSSTDGTGWTTVGQDTFAMTGAVYIGLAVCSHDATRLATAGFDNVVVK